MRVSLATLLGTVIAMQFGPGPTAARADAFTPIDSPMHDSIHQEQWRHFRESSTDLPNQSREMPLPPPLAPRTPGEMGLTHEVHGYHPYWMGTSYGNYRWETLSTVAFFSLDLDASGAIVDSHGWPWMNLIAQAHAHGVRVLVTATLFSSSALTQLLGDPGLRATAVANLVAAVQAGNADGVSIDFENMPGSRKAELVRFMDELRSALEAAIDDPYISIATPAVDWTNAFDYDELAARVDHLMIMAYNYTWSGSPTSGPVAPLQGWGTYNVAWTIADYLTWGAPRDKMILGVPYYGLRWNTATDQPGAATTGSGSAMLYDAAQPGAEFYGRLWDAPSSTPWYRFEAPTWVQTWYDDAPSLTSKYDRVLDETLAGVGIWALGYDGARTELWEALEDAFGTEIASPPDPGDPTVLAGGVQLHIASRHPFDDYIRFSLRVPWPRKIRLTVHDAAGRLVRVLADGRFERHDRFGLTWNGRDERGEIVPDGVYLVRVPGGSALRVVKVR